MPNLQDLYQDPRFQSLNEDKQSNVITGVISKDPKFLALPDDKKAFVLNGIMANVRKSAKPTEQQPKSDHNIIGSVAAAADMVLGLPAAIAQTGIETLRADVGMFVGEKAAIQKGVAAGKPLDKWQGFVSEQVDKHYGAGTVANSSLGRIFGKVSEKIQEGQQKVAGADPEKQAAAKIGTDVLLNIVAPHVVVGAGKAIKGLGKSAAAEAVDTPEARATLKDRLKQAMPEASEETIKQHTDHAISNVTKALTDADRHINAEAKANDLMQRGASKKEVEAAIKKNPLVGKKMEEIRQRRAEVVGATEPSGVGEAGLRPQTLWEGKKAQKASDIEKAWEAAKGTPAVSKEEAFKRAETEEISQRILDTERKRLFEEQAAGKIPEPSQASRRIGGTGRKGFGQGGAVALGLAPEHIEITAPEWGGKLEDFHGVFTPEALSKAKEGHVVMMSPEEFNKLAYPREATYRDLSPVQIKALGEEKRAPLRASIAAGKGIRDIPSLDVKEGKVVGHDGRHRADVLIEHGYDKIPVRIKGEAPVAGQHVVSETGDFRTQLPPPISRKLGGVGGRGFGQGGAADPEFLAKMGLTAGGALAGYLLAGQNKMDKPAGAILGALAGFGVARMPTFIKALGDNWKRTLATTATAGTMVGVGSYLDEQDPLEGALFGAAFAASRNLPKAKKLSEEELVVGYHDGLMAHDRLVHNLTNQIKTLIPDEAARKDLYEKMHRGDFSKMNANEREVAETWKAIQQQYGEMAKNENVIKGFIEDYVPRIASQMNMSQSEVQRLVSEIVPERTNVSGSTKSKFSKARTQDTFDDFLKAAKAKGLDVGNVDFADVVGNYMKSMNRAIQGARLIKTLETVKGSDGKPANYIMGAEDAPRDYRSVSNPQLRGKRVHPELADALEIVMGGRSHHDITNAALALNSAAKRINVVGSFFHAKSLAEAHLLAGRNPLDFQGVKAALDMYKNGGAGDTVDKLIRSGLTIAVPDDAPLGTFSKLGDLLDLGIKKSLGVEVKPFGKVFTAAEKAQLATFDRVTWDFLHSGFKLAGAMKELEAYRTGRKYKGMSEAEAMKGISSAMNDTYGGINWARAHQETQSVVGRKLMSLISTPNGRDMVGLLAFAPDWTMSTLRMFSKALPGGAENPANVKLARKYVLNSALAYLLGVNLVNMATSGHPIWENKKSKTKIELPDGTSMQLMKHAMEPYEALTEPVKFITNKLGTPAKLASLALTSSTSFNPQYPVSSRIGTAASLVSPFTTTSLYDPTMSTQEALLRGAAGALGVGIYGTSNAVKQTDEYKKRQRERYARLHQRKPQ